MNTLANIGAKFLNISISENYHDGITDFYRYLAAIYSDKTLFLIRSCFQLVNPMIPINKFYGAYIGRT